VGTTCRIHGELRRSLLPEQLQVPRTNEYRYESRNAARTLPRAMGSVSRTRRNWTIGYLHQ
jgi:hypothetical protein